MLANIVYGLMEIVKIQVVKRKSIVNDSLKNISAQIFRDFIKKSMCSGLKNRVERCVAYGFQ